MDGCFQWFPSFDMLTGDLLTPANPERLKGLMRTRHMMDELLQHMVDCGFNPSNIFFFGFSQGGTVALDIVSFGKIRNLGGVVSISGYLLEEQRVDRKIGDGYAGYILITQGEKDQTIGTKAEAEKRQLKDNALPQRMFHKNLSQTRITQCLHQKENGD
ncbi:unnamed protein product [Mucor hiemalis]